MKTATIEFLKIKLEEDGLHFRGSIPDDGNSFFKACSDQLQLLEISGHTHSELRQMVIPNLQLYTEVSIITLFFIIYIYIYGLVHSQRHYVIKFVSDLRQVGGLLHVLWFPPPINLTATI